MDRMLTERVTTDVVNLAEIVVLGTMQVLCRPVIDGVGSQA
jgi:hypothetical protein